MDTKLTGTELRIQRDLEGITRAALAAELGVTEQTLWNWEREGAPTPGKQLRYLRGVDALRSRKREAA